MQLVLFGDAIMPRPENKGRERKAIKAKRPNNDPVEREPKKKPPETEPIDGSEEFKKRFGPEEDPLDMDEDVTVIQEEPRDTKSMKEVKKSAYEGGKRIKIKSWNGIGDLLFCTPTIHAIKSVHPEVHITVSTNCPELLEFNPYVDKIDRVNKEGVFLGYADPIHRKNPTKHHIMADYEIITKEFGFTDVPEPPLQPEIYLPVAKEKNNIVGVQVIHKGHWDNKKVWQKFPELSRRPGFRPIGTYRTHKELVYGLSQYKAIVCAEGGLSHIAKAIGLPAVVIYGGFAKPEWNGYEDQISLCNPQPCSYCYNPDDCVNHIPRKCMVEITMETVLRAVEGLEKIPELARHNAKQFCERDAKEWCKGKGLDIGGGKWPFSNARNIDEGDKENALHIKEPDNSQDYVFSSHCLEHIPDIYGAIKEWCRVIRPGGILYLYLPHPDYIPWRVKSMSKWHKHDLTEEVLWKLFASVPEMEVIEHVPKDRAFGRKIILRKKETK